MQCKMSLPHIVRDSKVLVRYCDNIYCVKLFISTKLLILKLELLLWNHRIMWQLVNVTHLPFSDSVTISEKHCIRHMQGFNPVVPQPTVWALVRGDSTPTKTRPGSTLGSTSTRRTGCRMRWRRRWRRRSRTSSPRTASSSWSRTGMSSPVECHWLFERHLMRWQSRNDIDILREFRCKDLAKATEMNPAIWISRFFFASAWFTQYLYQAMQGWGSSFSKGTKFLFWGTF